MQETISSNLINRHNYAIGDMYIYEPLEVHSLLQSMYPNSSSPDQICIWGAGANGMRMQMFLQLQGIPVACYGDNNRQKQGTSVLGIPCLSEEELEQYKYRTLIVVCVRGHWKEIKSQLHQNGFPYVWDENELYRTIPAHNKLEKLAEGGCYEEITQILHRINCGLLQRIQA